MFIHHLNWFFFHESLWIFVFDFAFAFVVKYIRTEECQILSLISVCLHFANCQFCCLAKIIFSDKDWLKCKSWKKATWTLWFDGKIRVRLFYHHVPLFLYRFHFFQYCFFRDLFCLTLFFLLSLSLSSFNKTKFELIKKIINSDFLSLLGIVRSKSGTENIGSSMKKAVWGGKKVIPEK